VIESLEKQSPLEALDIVSELRIAADNVLVLAKRDIDLEVVELSAAFVPNAAIHPLPSF